eukprot:GHRR01007135.1.p1 GENE.GHRR01007135.1~~GHRR01007135.1.p1  ORF type:complete len:459 (+),score=184.18 GHRR01007135.1:244-1620(+)
MSNTEIGLPAGTKAFQIPLYSVSVTDSNAAGFLAELGMVDRVALADKYSYNECLQAINVCGNGAVDPSEPVDYDPSPANDAEFNASVVEWQQLSSAQNSKVDAIFTSMATDNPKSIAVTSYADPGVLNRAEWVKFVAVFFNKEVEAEKLFNQITSDYQALNKTARAAVGDKQAPTKTVWISKFGDVASINFASYKRQYMTDAGGVLPAASDIAAAGGQKVDGQYSTVNYNFNLSVPTQKQGFVDIISQVDKIFDDTYGFGTGNLENLEAFITAYNLTGATADIPAVQNGQVWSLNNRLSSPAADGSVGSDWFEGSTARPDLVLEDFVKVITPAALPGNTQLTWLRQLSASASALKHNSPAQCEAIKTAEGDAARCQRAAPARICPNAYRDCTTGELKTVTDPTQRCDVRTVCQDATSTSNSSGTATPTKNAAGGKVAAATLIQLLLTGLGLMLLVLML